MTIWRSPSELVIAAELYWKLYGPAGEAAIRVRVDFCQEGASADEMFGMLQRWWSSVWAPLISSSVFVSATGWIPITGFGPGQQWLPENWWGHQEGPPASRIDSVVIVWYGGEISSDANQRHYVPFIPQSWVAVDVLSDVGMSRFQTAMRGVYQGCDHSRGGRGFRLILWQPARPANSWQEARPARWADVKQLVICSYLDRAPLP